jgi:hypothetical protein
VTAPPAEDQQGSDGGAGQVGLFLAFASAIVGWLLVAGLRAVGLMEGDASFDLLELARGLVVILFEGEGDAQVAMSFLGLCIGATIVGFTAVLVVASAVGRVPGLRSRQDVEERIQFAGWAVAPAGLVLLAAASDQWRDWIIGLGVVLFALMTAGVVVVIVIALWRWRFR